MDIPTNDSAMKLSATLNNFSLRQHVNSPTHSGGHILDLVISMENSPLVKGIAVTEGISDHKGIKIKLNVAKQRRIAIKKTFYQYKKLNMSDFQKDILGSELYTNP